MNDNFDKLLDKLEAARSNRALRSALVEFTSCAGFDCFAYMHLRGTAAEVFTDYPHEWRNRYIENHYEIVDPVIASARRSLRLEYWSSEAPGIQRGSAQWRFFRDAEAFGLRSGISVPIRVGFGGIAILAFASKQRLNWTSKIEPFRAHTAVAFLHIKLSEFSSSDFRDIGLCLSPRETLCLNWASFGKSMKETAALIGISERTVRFYLDRARDKLLADNIAHAIRIAVERGII